MLITVKNTLKKIDTTNATSGPFESFRTLKRSVKDGANRNIYQYALHKKTISKHSSVAILFYFWGCRINPHLINLPSRLKWRVANRADRRSAVASTEQQIKVRQINTSAVKTAFNRWTDKHFNGKTTTLVNAINYTF